MQKLIQGLLFMFVKDNLFMKNKKIRSFGTIYDIDLNDTKNHKPKCDLGSKYKSEANKLDALGQKQLDDLMRKFLIGVTSYLVENLPYEKSIIKDAQFLHPHQPLTDDKCVDSIQRLSSDLWDALTVVHLRQVFGLKEGTKKSDFLDIIKREFAAFRLETLPDDFLPDTSVEKKRVSKPSYWRQCYALAGLDRNSPDDGQEVKAVEFWIKVGQLKDVDGNLQYPCLSKMALCVLLLPHGNADPERGFSINKKMLENHGTNLDGETLQALRLIKDYLIQIGGPQHVKINRKMMESCQKSRMKYEEYKQAQEKKKEQEAMSKEEEKAAANEKEDEIAMEAKTFAIQTKLKLADDMIDDGNKLLKA